MMRNHLYSHSGAFPAPSNADTIGAFAPVIFLTFQTVK